MVSSLLVDALSNPDSLLQDLYPKNDFPEQVSAHFSRIFTTTDAFNQIPPLNPQEPHHDRSLVYFRAMVQDTSPSPQMYLAQRAGGKCGGWGLSDDDDSIDYAHLKECTVVWAVTVPGEGSWIGRNASSGPSPRPHKYPVPDALHVGVQVKVYDKATADSLKATDILTFVGILTAEPLHADLELPEPSLVPTLHVLFSRSLPPTIVPRIYPYSPPTVSINDLREELITWIADEALAGDHEAAEWVLLCTIARVQSRNPPILPPSLVLSHFPPPSSASSSQIPALLHLLSHVLPMLSTLPLSLQILNNAPFAPESKNEDLHSGWLQLPKGSVCVVTEGGVTEGGVTERGIMNIRAAQEMMDTQMLEYIFPYSRFGFETDVAFVILTEGRKSAFFRTSINIPLKLVSEGDLYKPADAITLPSEEKLELFRRLIGGAKVGRISIGEGAAEYIQEKFVKERKAPESEAANVVTAEELIQRILVARLLALSLHEKEVNVDIWERTKVLEATRKARASSLPSHQK